MTCCIKTKPGHSISDSFRPLRGLSEGTSFCSRFEFQNPLVKKGRQKKNKPCLCSLHILPHPMRGQPTLAVPLMLAQCPKPLEVSINAETLLNCRTELNASIYFPSWILTPHLPSVPTSPLVLLVPPFSLHSSLFFTSHASSLLTSHP